MSNFLVCRFCEQGAKKGSDHHCDEMKEGYDFPEQRVPYEPDGFYFIDPETAERTDNWSVRSFQPEFAEDDFSEAQYSEEELREYFGSGGEFSEGGEIH